MFKVATTSLNTCITMAWNFAALFQISLVSVIQQIGSFISSKQKSWHLKYAFLIIGFITQKCGLRVTSLGPGFDPRSGQVSWVRVFRGFSSLVRQMSGSFRSPRSPNIIWPSLSSIVIHYGRQWPELSTRPKTSNIQIDYTAIEIHSRLVHSQKTLDAI